MKRFIFTVFCMALISSVYAQKSYIHIYATYLNSFSWNGLQLTGDIPSGIKSYYGTDDKMFIGTLLNQLSELGYEVELMSAPNYTKESNETKMIYLLSKNKSDNVNSVRVVKDDDDSDVYEIARYNLQGMQINKKEKGLQIIVYSNYTTKTIINE